MCVCVCVCVLFMYMYVCSYVRMYLCMHGMYLHMYACMYTQKSDRHWYNTLYLVYTPILEVYRYGYFGFYRYRLYFCQNLLITGH